MLARRKVHSTEDAVAFDLGCRVATAGRFPSMTPSPFGGLDSRREKTTLRFTPGLTPLPLGAALALTTQTEAPPVPPDSQEPSDFDTPKLDLAPDRDFGVGDAGGRGGRGGHDVKSSVSDWRSRSTKNALLLTQSSSSGTWRCPRFSARRQRASRERGPLRRRRRLRIARKGANSGDGGERDRAALEEGAVQASVG